MWYTLVTSGNNQIQQARTAGLHYVVKATHLHHFVKVPKLHTEPEWISQNTVKQKMKQYRQLMDSSTTIVYKTELNQQTHIHVYRTVARSLAKLDQIWHGENLKFMCENRYQPVGRGNMKLTSIVSQRRLFSGRETLLENGAANIVGCSERLLPL